MVTYYASVGGTRHLFYLSPPEKLRAIEFNWLSQPGAIFALFTSKASVALLVLRLIGPNTFWRKYILYFVIVTVFITNSLALIFTFVQCNPVQALWNPTIPANCWDPSVQADYNYFNGGNFLILSAGTLTKHHCSIQCLRRRPPRRSTVHSDHESKHEARQQTQTLYTFGTWSNVSIL